MISSGRDRICSSERWTSGDLQIANGPSPLVTIPIKVNGTDASALLDTGTARTTISRRLANQEGLKPDYIGDAQSVGGRHAVMQAHGLTLDIGLHQVALDHVDIVDLESVNRSSNNSIDVIIGADILSQTVWAVNFDNHKTALSCQSSFTAPGWTAVNVVFADKWKRPKTEIRVYRNILHNILIDTGADTELQLTSKAEAAADGRKRYVTDIAVAGFGGIDINKIVSLDEVYLNGIYDGNVQVQVEPVGGFLENSGFDGSLGMGIISKYNFIMNGPGGKIYLSSRMTPPNQSLKSTVGLQIVYGINSGTVLHTMSNSPADKAGIRKGYEICVIDGTRISVDWNKSESRRWGTSPPGTEHTVVGCDRTVVKLTSKKFY